MVFILFLKDQVWKFWPKKDGTSFCACSKPLLLASDKEKKIAIKQFLLIPLPTKCNSSHVQSLVCVPQTAAEGQPVEVPQYEGLMVVVF